MDIYEIFYRNQQGEIEGQIETFESLTLEPVFNDVGTWSLIAPVEVLLRVAWNGGIVVHRNGSVFFTGRMWELHRRKDATAFPVINTLEATGYSDTSHLADVLALPVPGGPPYNSAEFDVRTGKFETVVKGYVNDNVGPAAKLDRLISGLTIETDYGRGEEITGQARYEYLIDLIKSLALQSGGIGFEILDMEFRVYQTADKSSSVVFSEDLGNLSGFEYDLARPKANYLYLGGTGSGSSRVISEGSDSESILIFGRIEEFLDQNSLSDESQINAKIFEELTKKSTQMTLRLKVIDLPNMRPIDDYWLGDKVTAIVDGNEIVDVITSMPITITPTGVVVEPVIGINDMARDEMAAIYTRIRNINSRLSTMERI